MKRLILIFIATLIFWGLPTEVSASQKYALIIGNSAYEQVPLQNPVNDANALAIALKKLDFRVIKKTDVSQQEMEEAIRLFEQQLAHEDIALFYFSGHGVQVNGNNYLLPIGVDIRSADEVKYKAVNAEMVLSKLETAGSRLNIIILDACRNNPFKGVRSASQGLAQMNAPTGTLIAYATAPGRVAYDGDGPNSPYTTHLLGAMQLPGVEIEKVFKQVRVAVMAETNQQQVPWESSSLTGDFFFVPPNVSTPTPTSTPPPTPTPDFDVHINTVRIYDEHGKLIPSQDSGQQYHVPLNTPFKIEIDVINQSHHTLKINWRAGKGKLLPLEDSLTNTYIATQHGGDYIVVIISDQQTKKELTYTITVYGISQN